MRTDVPRRVTYLLFHPPHRCSFVSAIATFILLGHWLPGRSQLQTVELLDDAGQVKQSISLDVADQRLQRLIAKIEEKRDQRYSKPDKYYAVKWQAEVAAIYANDRRGLVVMHSGSSLEVQQDPKVSAASHPTKTADDENASLQDLQTESRIDSEYWSKLRDESNRRLEEYEVIANRATRGPQPRLAGVDLGPRSAFWFAVQMSLTTLTFLIFRYLCVGRDFLMRFSFRDLFSSIFALVDRRTSHQTTASAVHDHCGGHLELRCRLQLALPVDMYKVRTRWSDRVMQLNLWLPLEVSIVLGLLYSFMFHG